MKYDIILFDYYSIEGECFRKCKTMYVTKYNYNSPAKNARIE